MNRRDELVSKLTELKQLVQYQEGFPTLDALNMAELSAAAHTVAQARAHNQIVRNWKPTPENAPIDNALVHEIGRAVEIAITKRTNMVSNLCRDCVYVFQLFVKDRKQYSQLSNAMREEIYKGVIRHLRKQRQWLSDAKGAFYPGIQGMPIRRWAARFTEQVIAQNIDLYEAIVTNALQSAKRAHDENSYRLLADATEMCLECIVNVTAMLDSLRKLSSIYE